MVSYALGVRLMDWPFNESVNRYIEIVSCNYDLVNRNCDLANYHWHNRLLWASYQIRKIAGCACAGNAGNVFPRRRFLREPLVSDPGMHHGTCVTHVPWCMPGSLTCGDGENVPGIPGACASAILRIWQEAHVFHWHEAWRYTTSWLIYKFTTRSQTDKADFYFKAKPSLGWYSFCLSWSCSLSQYFSQTAHKSILVAFIGTILIKLIKKCIPTRGWIYGLEYSGSFHIIRYTTVYNRKPPLFYVTIINNLKSAQPSHKG